MATSKALIPLNAMTPIVDSDGLPTPYFAKLLQRLQVSAELGVNQTTGTVGVSTSGIANSMLANMAAGTIKGNSTTSSAAPQDLTLSQTLDIIGGATWGDVLFRSQSLWKRLPAGTAGQFLQTQGATADPVWATASSGGGSYPQITLTKPTLSNFTLLNTGTGVTMTTTTFGVLVWRDATSNAQLSMAQYNVAAPGSTAFNVTARMALKDPRYGGGYSGCLFLRNSTSGRILVHGSYNNDSNPLGQHWTALNGAFASDIITRPTLYGFTANFPWRRIVLSGGNINLDCSPDGDIWYTLGTTTPATYLTATGGTIDQVGFGSYSTSSSALCQSFTLT